jgi:hypothetical protein
VILHNIPDGAGLILERSSTLNSEVFGHRDLHALDLIAVPERLQECILETEKDHVMHRPFSQVMIDAENMFLVEMA